MADGTHDRSEERLLTIAEVAAWLHVSERWVRDKVTAEELPHTRVGKHVRFTREQVRMIIEHGLRNPRTVRRGRWPRL